MYVIEDIVDVWVICCDIGLSFDVFLVHNEFITKFVVLKIIVITIHELLINTLLLYYITAYLDICIM